MLVSDLAIRCTETIFQPKHWVHKLIKNIIWCDNRNNGEVLAVVFLLTVSFPAEN